MHVVGILLGVVALANGLQSEANTAKYHVDILLKKSAGWQKICGGGIIHRRFVLTSGYCVRGRRPSELLARAGGSRPAPRDRPYLETREYKRIAWVYRLGERTPDDDRLAVVKIVGRFDLMDYSSFELIYLPISNFDYKGKKAIVSGYKVDDGKKKLRSLSDEYDTLRSLEANVMSNKECQAVVKSNVTDSDLCTGPLLANPGGCFGYPGDPLIFNRQIIGVLNSTSCNSSGPSVYSRVSTYISYIKDVTYGFNII